VCVVGDVYIPFSLMVEYSTPCRSSHSTAGLPVGDVTVNHLIRLALLSELPGCLDGRFASMFVQIRVAHDFAANELVLKFDS